MALDREVFKWPSY